MDISKNTSVTASCKILRAESYLLLNCILIQKEWLEDDTKKLYKKELSIVHVSEEMSRDPGSSLYFY